MRREYINYPFDLTIKISFLNIKNHPTHWHNSIEIIYVLKGSLNITIDTDSFTLNEREVEIINSDESHSISAIDDNKVLNCYWLSISMDFKGKIKQTYFQFIRRTEL